MGPTAIGLLLWTMVVAQPVPAESPDLTLDGVIVAASPADSVALVRLAGSPRAHILRIGNEIHGYLLLEITKAGVRLQGRGHELRLALGGNSLSSEVGSALAKGSGESEWIRRQFPREASRDRLQKEIPVILSETDLTPKVEDGEVKGLRVARLPDGTLLSESGLLPEDILVSINGEPLVGIDALWEIIARLVDQEEIRIVVRRRGETLKLAYAFTP